MAAVAFGSLTHLFQERLEDWRHADDVAETGVTDLVAYGDEVVESRAVLPPTVPAEDKFLEVDVEVTTADTVIDTHHPPLHQREDAVDALEPEMCWEFAVDFRGVLAVGNPLVGLIAVGEDRGTRRGVPQHEWMQGFPAIELEYSLIGGWTRAGDKLGGEGRTDGQDRLVLAVG